MKIEEMPNIERMVKQGFDLDVTACGNGRFQAAVYLGRLNGPESHHYIGNSIVEAVAGLERHIDVP